jgi:hypothetical protein
VTGDAALTVAAIRAKGWEVVKLKGKRPIGKHWEVTKDADQVAEWIACGHNIGLVCHERTGVAVLDPDCVEWADMVDALGQPCLPWVITGSGKLHYYIRWEPELPAKLEWEGRIVGEIQRGPGQQQVVLPPSVHPNTGARYRWISHCLLPEMLCEPVDPIAGPLPTLPGLWLAYLRAAAHAA